MKSFFVLRNTKTGKYLQVKGDGSEGLEMELALATAFKNKKQAEEAIEEHDKWVGPLEIKEILLLTKL